MSERWKYQIKIGLFWGVFITVFMTLFNDKTFSEQIENNKFYWRFLINIIAGIVIVGYFFWKGKDEKNNSWSTFFKKNSRKRE